MTYLPFKLFGLYAQTVQSATVTNTTTETSIIGTGVGGLTVAPNTFRVGDSYHGKIGGVISNQNNDEITIRIKTGTTVLATTGLISLTTATSQGWEFIDTTISNTLDITVEWNQAKTQDEIYSANFVLFKTY